MKFQKKTRFNLVRTTLANGIVLSLASLTIMSGGLTTGCASSNQPKNISANSTQTQPNETETFQAKLARLLVLQAKNAQASAQKKPILSTKPTMPTKPLGEYSLTKKSDNMMLDNLNQIITNRIKWEIENAGEPGIEKAIKESGGVTARQFNKMTKQSGNFSKTNLIEQGVDEEDFVKQDKDHIYMYSSPTGESIENRKAIRIYDKADFTVNINTGNANMPKPISTIDVPMLNYLSGIYLTKKNRKEQLHTLSLQDNRRSYQKVWDDSKGEYRNKTAFIDINSYDVSDTHKPKPIDSIKLDGDYKHSRLLNNNLFVIMQTDILPQFSCDDELDYKEQVKKWKSQPEDSIKTCQQQHTLTEEKLIKLMPKDVNGERIDPKQCYVPQILPSEKNAYQYTNLTLINKINLTDRKKSETICAVTGSSTRSGSNSFYMGQNSLYFVNSRHERVELTKIEKEEVKKSNPQSTQTSMRKSYSFIHKFRLDDNVEYAGANRLNGRIGWEAQKYGINEYKGVLRVVTHENVLGGIKNRLHTLAESDDKLELNILASLPNKQQPKPIGKPNEQIKSVRFLGEEAYITTFRNTDPLYKLDLSNPKAPKIVGELEMPGYSAYLHRINDKYLLGIGFGFDDKGNQTGIQTTVFAIDKVTNTNDLKESSLKQNPKIIDQDSVKTNTDNLNTMLRFYPNRDSKGLSFIETNNTLRVTIPYFHSTKYKKHTHYWDSKALEYEIDLNTGKFVNKIRRTNHELAPDYSQGNARFRALIHDNDLYYTTDDGVINKYEWGKE